jgi:hypothetical protein
MQKLAQLKTAQSIETAASNPGLGGAGIGLGVGLGMGNMFANTFNSAQQAQQTQQSQQNNNTPPPPPQVFQFFVAVNGQQTGPFSIEQARQMVQSGSLTTETQVWKAGMSGWAKAATLAELTSIFGSVPPPPPPAG